MLWSLVDANLMRVHVNVLTIELVWNHTLALDGTVNEFVSVRVFPCDGGIHILL